MMNLKSILFSFLGAGIFYNCSAQKLPEIQTKSVFLKDNIKIDGQLLDWQNQFQAYNHATDLFYTMANDDKQLYLIVQANQPRIIEKILDVGITLEINAISKNYPTEKPETITFPNLTVPDAQKIITAAKIKSTHTATVKSILPETVDDLKGQTVADTTLKTINLLMASLAKEIKVKNIPSIADTVISSYNEQQIVAVASFNTGGVYIYALRLPLKMLNISTANGSKLKYSIKLKSRLEDFKKGTHVIYKYRKDDTQYDVDQDLDSTTDFSAEYILAKSPTR